MCCLNNCFLLTKYHNDSKMEETVQNTTVTNLVKYVYVSIWKKTTCWDYKTNWTKTFQDPSLQIFLSLLFKKVISNPWDKVKWTTQSTNSTLGALCELNNMEILGHPENKFIWRIQERKWNKLNHLWIHLLWKSDVYASECKCSHSPHSAKSQKTIEKCMQQVVGHIWTEDLLCTSLLLGWTSFRSAEKHKHETVRQKPTLIHKTLQAAGDKQWVKLIFFWLLGPQLLLFRFQ